jgi:glucose-6-phosphate 1-dehydrogenase
MESTTCWSGTQLAIGIAKHGMKLPAMPQPPLIISLPGAGGDLAWRLVVPALDNLYRNEPGAAPASNIETRAALKLYMDNWRWQDVQSYLRTGKRMAADGSELSIRFQPVPHQAWPDGAATEHGPIRLVLRLHPDEGMDLKLNPKSPGTHFALKQQDLRFGNADACQAAPPKPDETLLSAVLAGDQGLFMRADQVTGAWLLPDPVLRSWAELTTDFPDHAAGRWGPESAERLINLDGRGRLKPTLPPT